MNETPKQIADRLRKDKAGYAGQSASTVAQLLEYITELERGLEIALQQSERECDYLFGILTAHDAPDSEFTRPCEPEMVQIPAGTFTMGSDKYDNEQPLHEVTVPSFYIGKYQITQAQWRAVMGNNPSRFRGDNLPVENVSWNDAQEFCKKISEMTGKEYRLPTEAEWEYACRAGTTGDYAGDLDTMGWHNDNSDSTTHLVGLKQPNAFGLYDMHGNVWEWCKDTWHDNYKGAPTDGSAWLSGGDSIRRVLRGGSWIDLAFHCRSAYRNAYLPDLRLYDFGFRVVVAAKTEGSND